MWTKVKKGLYQYNLWNSNSAFVWKNRADVYYVDVCLIEEKIFNQKFSRWLSFSNIKSSGVSYISVVIINGHCYVKEFEFLSECEMYAEKKYSFYNRKEIRERLEKRLQKEKTNK